MQQLANNEKMYSGNSSAVVSCVMFVVSSLPFEFDTKPEHKIRFAIRFCQKNRVLIQSHLRPASRDKIVGGFFY